MKTPGWIPLGVMSTALCALPAPAPADTAGAYCEVRRDGETKHDRSGACDFSQRQGYVSIDLRNGESWEMSPGDKPDHFRDQKGNRVVRTASGDSAAGSTDSFDTVCGVMVDGKDYAYRCQVTDHYCGDNPINYLSMGGVHPVLLTLALGRCWSSSASSTSL